MTWYQVKTLMKRNLELALKEPTSSAFLASAWWEVRNRQYEEALVEIDKAITLNPNDSYNFTMKAAIMNKIGLSKEAELNALRAIRLNPKNASIHIRLLGVSLFHQDRFIESAVAFEKAALLEPDYEWNYLDLASTYGHLGELLKAKTALEKFEAIRADREHAPSTVQEISNRRNQRDRSFEERFIEGLRKAGMPER
jgi:Tfp pilus assembly protein PilF